MKTIVCKTAEEFDRTAASFVARQIKEKPNSVLGLATGGTPVGMYQELIRMVQSGKLSFKEVVTFNLDEYVGLPADHACSYHTFMKKNLFDSVDINMANTHIPNGQAPDLKKECEEYEKAIAKAGGIDLQVLGIGHNGHIGFNEPGTPFDSLTHVIELDQRTIRANQRFFNSEEEVPRKAISMGIKSIMRARKIILMVKGRDKAEILAKALYGPITPAVPASVLQLHPNIYVIADLEAASLLQEPAQWENCG